MTQMDSIPRCFAVFALGVLVTCSGAPPPEQRVIPAQLPPAERAAHRRLPLEGGYNTRDLGGYRTTDGRSVKWGLLYRSNALAELTDDDVAYLRRLDLRRVVDFRSPEERARDVDRLPENDGLEVVLRPIFGEGLDPAGLQDRILSGDASADEMVALLVAGNRAFVTDFGDVYEPFLHDLGDANSLPTLFHCTAGKDRAGFAAAVVLLALGVPREVVMEDYLRTNEFSAPHTESTLRLIRIVSLFRAHPDEVRPLFEARREYLDAAFEAIEAQYGTIDAYLRGGLGLDDALRQRLQANLLE